MKIQVLTDDGHVVFDFDGQSSSFLVSTDLKGEIANALHDASASLAQDHHVISSINSDISAVIGRIEHELGAHPAFTWAQTKLANAAAHLEAYVRGVWTEPVFPAGFVTDQRGAPVVQ